ncbi:MAG: GNAT family N-acetyltransferase [Clostridia bacterium]|nr:GNAT family N-acetyltransferase [Clostridia bacterium]
MIIEYNDKYEEKVKDLLVLLQEYISSIDKDGYNIVTKEFREEYFKKTIEEVEKYHGKIFLYEENKNVLGMIVGVINNEAISTYDYKVPKTGRITELIVTKNARRIGVGTKLMDYMEKYFKEVGCIDVLLGVFAYNEGARKFYEKNGYKARMTDMRKIGI